MKRSKVEGFTAGPFEPMSYPTPPSLDRPGHHSKMVVTGQKH